MRLVGGANEVNGLEKPAEYHQQVTHQIEETVSWKDPRLARIIRLRLISDPGFPVWDLSYCHGELKDGTPVRVDLPFYQVPKRRMMSFILDHAKKDGVFAKGLGLFDAISTLC